MHVLRVVKVTPSSASIQLGLLLLLLHIFLTRLSLGKKDRREKKKTLNLKTKLEVVLCDCKSGLLKLQWKESSAGSHAGEPFYQIWCHERHITIRPRGGGWPRRFYAIR